MAHRQQSLWRKSTSEAVSRPRFAEFFAGIGLVRLGLEKAGWQVAYANDIDPVKRRMYDVHFGDADEHFELGDVRKVDPQSLPRIDLATASFPCTDLSLAGGRAGLRAGESSAFWAFVDVLKGMGSARPPIVLLENVVGFLSSHGGKDFREAMLALNSLGYSVDPFVLDARWFVPQSRPRMFVVASVLPPNEPSITGPSRVRPAALVEAIREHRDVAWRLRSLPEPPMTSSKSLEGVLELLEDDAAEWWTRDRVAYLYRQMSDRHRAIVRDQRRLPQWSYGTVFRRVRPQKTGGKKSMAELRTDGFAGCLRTPKGGSGRQILVRMGHGRLDARLLTPRECARLMGADEFRVSGTTNEALFGFGDAVCVPAIAWIGEHVLSPELRNVRGGSLLLK